MTIDVDTPQSPGWWLKRLSKKLLARNDEIQELFDRYEGDAPLPSSLRDAPDSARRFFKASRTSFAEMVVKSVKYPLSIQSVLTSADNGELGDREAWRMFSASGMSEETDEVHRVMFIAGDSYGIVQDYRGDYRYTSEDPREVITQHDPVVQSEVIAAAKFHYDSIQERAVATLWLEDATYQATKSQRTSRGYQRFGSGWEWNAEYGGEDGMSRPAPDGAAAIPVFRYRNEEGVGEFKRHRDLLDRLDHMVLQGMTIATYQAFKQRAIKAPSKDMPDKHPQTGEPIDYDRMFEADPGSLWRLPDTAEIWESGGIDMTPVWTGMEKFIQQLAAVTFTPLAMFSPEGQNQSASGASFAREGRTFKIEDRKRRLGHVHAKALATLFALNGDEDRSRSEDIEIVWRPSERYSLTEKTSALANSTSMPWQARMEEIMQFTPGMIERMKRQRLDDMTSEMMAAFDQQNARVAQQPASPEATPVASAVEVEQ